MFVRQTDEQWEPITWNRMRSMFCTDPGYSPLTIQSEAEQAFIGHYVQQYIQDRRSRNLDYLYIGRFGKMRNFRAKMIFVIDWRYCKISLKGS